MRSGECRWLVLWAALLVPAASLAAGGEDAAATAALATESGTATAAAEATAALGKGHLAAIYRRAAGAVVGVECVERIDRRRLQYFGSGVIVDPRGLVLTSITVVPEKGEDIRLYVRGGRTLRADILATVEEYEFCLLRAREPMGALPYLPLGDSAGVRVGQIGLTLGNAFHSIRNDDQVAFAAGHVSGSYRLDKTRPQARYVGPVFETTAAFNDGMDGGPLVNERGEVIGLLSLNFSPQRWLGTAVPINLLKPLFGKHRAWHSDRDERSSRYVGIEVSARSLDGSDVEAVRVDRVYDGGPAQEAGLAADMTIVALDGEAVATPDALRKLLDAAPRGKALRFRVRGGGARQEAVSIESSAPEGERDILVTPWERF